MKCNREQKRQESHLDRKALILYNINYCQCTQIKQVTINKCKTY